LLTLIGFVGAIAMFWHCKRHLERHRLGGDRRRKHVPWDVSGDDPPQSSQAQCSNDWQRVWTDKWAQKLQHKVEREQRRWERHAARAERRWGVQLTPHVHPVNWPLSGYEALMDSHAEAALSEAIRQTLAAPRSPEYPDRAKKV